MMIKLIGVYTPEYIKRKKLDELFRLTADAFEAAMPELGNLSFSERLSRYASFTEEQAERCLMDGCIPDDLKSRLYDKAFAFGENLRKKLHIKNWEESIEALSLIYRLIGIDFRYDAPDKFEIRTCFFSKYYSADVCRLISSLDQGLAAGLSGGGKLTFKQRITDGSSCCGGCLKQGGLE